MRRLFASVIQSLFLCKEIQKDFLKDIKGSYKDPEGYLIAEKNPELFEKYDSKFPKKEKLKCPGQLFEDNSHKKIE